MKNPEPGERSLVEPGMLFPGNRIQLLPTEQTIKFRFKLGNKPC